MKELPNNNGLTPEQNDQEAAKVAEATLTALVHEPEKKESKKK